MWEWLFKFREFVLWLRPREVRCGPWYAIGIKDHPLISQHSAPLAQASINLVSTFCSQRRNMLEGIPSSIGCKVARLRWPAYACAMCYFCLHINPKRMMTCFSKDRQVFVLFFFPIWPWELHILGLFWERMGSPTSGVHVRHLIWVCSWIGTEEMYALIFSDANSDDISERYSC